MSLRNRRVKHGVLLLLIAGMLAGAAAGVFLGLIHDLPQIRRLESFTPSAVTRVYSADHNLLAEIYETRRDPVDIDRIPRHLKLALITTEDRSFYSHSGINLKGISRATIRNILAGRYVEGASTITQQLAKTLFLTPRKTLTRKLREALLAIQLERRYTKDEILEFYLNQVYLGSGAYGVEAASRKYFGKPVDALNLSECALIAALPRSPSNYSPLINKPLALKRRNIVLKQMRDQEIITEAQYLRAKNNPMPLGRQGNDDVIHAPYFIEYLKRRLEVRLGSSTLYKGGLTIHTTLSLKLQKAAEKAIEKGLRNLESRMAAAGRADPAPQSALVSVNVRSGGIVAMVGGLEYQKSPFNRATDARRQPGSAFKPVVYAYAVEQGFEQTRFVLDAPVVFKGARKGQDWQPENFSKTYEGEITLRRALALSKNIPAVRLIEMLGPSSVSRFGHVLGITSPLSANLSLALGTSEVSLLELTSVYATFANGGERIKPFAVLEILNRNGRSIYRAKPEKKIAMSRAGAAVITNMLEGVINEGTGRRARLLGRPVAGKTGTTDNYNDALFIGYSPTIAAGVWVGMDSHGTLGSGGTGAVAALPIWIDFMAEALAGTPYRHFDIPDGVERIQMDPATGAPASKNTRHPVMVLLKKKANHL